MNGGQDLGGMMGFGPVIPEAEDDIFHGEWEKTAFALTIGVGSLGLWNIDKIRKQRESLPPGEYLTTRYYEIWLKAMQAMLLKDGLITEEEIRSGHSHDAAPIKTPVAPDQITTMLARGTQYTREPDRAAAYAVGARVRMNTAHPIGHTRLPRYARGKVGVIERIAGFFVFPDTASAGEGDQPQWLYTVTFEARELWGPQADATSTISIDAWESYFEHV